MELTWNPDMFTTTSTTTATTTNAWGGTTIPWTLHDWTIEVNQNSTLGQKEFSIASIAGIDYIKASDETKISMITVIGEEVRLMLRSQDVEVLLSLLDKRFPHPSERDLADLMAEN